MVEPNSTATGDDSNGVPNDEDGVTFPAFVPGQAGTVVVQATNTTSQNATVYGFIDFNGDGDFGDSGETATATVTAGSSGPVNLVFNVPSSVNISQALGARFRLSTDGSLGPDGPATNGEVEDYLLRFADYGDLPDTGAGTGIGNYNTTLADNGARHLIDGTTFLGSRVDAETDGQPNATATRRRRQRYARRRGWRHLPHPARARQTAKIQVVAGSAGYLSAFIDFNGDGLRRSPSPAAPTETPAPHRRPVLRRHPRNLDRRAANATGRDRQPLPPDCRAGQGGNSVTGQAASGEVEDYRSRPLATTSGSMPTATAYRMNCRPTV